MKKRIVVTGMGAITPVGKNVDTLWDSIKKGICGVDYIKSFDTSNFKVKIAAEVKDYNPEDYFERKEARRMDRYAQFAMAAAKEAFEQSGLDLNTVDCERMGVMIGSGIGGMQTTEKEHSILLEKGPGRVSPFYIPMAIANMGAGNIAIKYGAKAVCETVVTACASGSYAVGNAMRCIERGDADIMFAGGAEASITPLSLAGFISISALSTADDLKRASIPFDKERSGFVMGEGAGVLILESLEHALKRGAKILGEVVGYGASCDAYHITAPAPDGEGAARAMKLALNDAGIRENEISYINAHGTATYYNDKFETCAIKTVFKDDAYKIPVSSTKSMMGHLLGAAGAVESVVCLKALSDGYVPATIGLNVPDEECDLDYVPNKGRYEELNYAMSNSLGFGGHNASLIFKKWRQE